MIIQEGWHTLLYVCSWLVCLAFASWSFNVSMHKGIKRSEHAFSSTGRYVISMHRNTITPHSPLYTYLYVDNRNTPKVLSTKQSSFLLDNQAKIYTTRKLPNPSLCLHVMHHDHTFWMDTQPFEAKYILKIKHISQAKVHLQVGRYED